MSADATPTPASTLSGRVIAVTGAARGLGRSYVELLARLGADVVASDIDAEPLADIGTAAARSCGTITPIAADATSERGVDSILGTALDQHGRLDGVVANAGLLRSGPILRLSADDVDAVLAVHVRGTVLLTRAAGAHWRGEAAAGRPPRGSIVTTTSAAGLYGFRAEAIYSAAKAAVAAFTIVAADEYARFGVTVNAVAPMARTRLTSWMPAPESGDDPMDPAHVAPLVAWLVGPDAAGVTGRVFEAGGGRVSLPTGWTSGADGELWSSTDLTQVGATVRGLISTSPVGTPMLRATPAAG